MMKTRMIACGLLAGALTVTLGVTSWPAMGQQPAVPATAPVAPPSALPAYDYRPVALSLTGPMVADLDHGKIAQLAQQYAKATKDDEKRDIRKKLADELSKQFDKLAEKQQKDLEDLEKQVADLRALLKKRQDARESIINRRLDQVLQDAEGLGWGTPGASSRPNAFFRPIAP